MLAGRERITLIFTWRIVRMEQEWLTEIFQHHTGTWLFSNVGYRIHHMDKE